MVVSYDLETTGLSAKQCHILEVAVVYSDTLAWSSLVNPGPDALSRVQDIVWQITQLSRVEISHPSVPGFKLAADWLEREVAAMAAAHGGPPDAPIYLAAHNNELFDARVLQSEYKRAERAMPKRWRFVDSLRHAKSEFKGLPSYSLGVLADTFGLKREGEVAHRALADARWVDRLMKLKPRSGEQLAALAFTLPDFDVRPSPMDAAAAAAAAVARGPLPPPPRPGKARAGAPAAAVAARPSSQAGGGDDARAVMEAAEAAGLLDDDSSGGEDEEEAEAGEEGGVHAPRASKPKKKLGRPVSTPLPPPAAAGFIASAAARAPRRPNPHPLPDPLSAVLAASEGAQLLRADANNGDGGYGGGGGSAAAAAEDEAAWAGEAPLSTAIAPSKKALLADLAVSFASVERLLFHHPRRFVPSAEWRRGCEAGSRVFARGEVVKARVFGGANATCVEVTVCTASGDSVSAQFWRTGPFGLRAATSLRDAHPPGTRVVLRGTWQAPPDGSSSPGLIKSAEISADGGQAPEGAEEGEAAEEGGNASSAFDELDESPYGAPSSELITPSWSPVKGRNKDVSPLRWGEALSACLDAADAAEARRGDWLAVALAHAGLPFPPPGLDGGGGARKRRGSLNGAFGGKLIGGAEALRAHHTAPSDAAVASARARLAFEELLLLQVSLLLRRAADAHGRTSVPCGSPAAVSSAVRGLAAQRGPGKPGLRLSPGQQAALEDILLDMASCAPPMVRLLAGDTGCGKTLVALLAVLAAVEGGAQAAFMAPTGLLAEQHARSFAALLAASQAAPASRPRFAVLTGSLREAERSSLVAGMRAPRGDPARLDVVFGTHALIHERDSFACLGLAVVDEEQRFGSGQRAALRTPCGSTGVTPHFLSLSATPIPRSLALAAHGDAALSFIPCRPEGVGAPVSTTAAAYSDNGGTSRDDALAAVRAEVDAGGQAYIVYPNVDDDALPSSSTAADPSSSSSAAAAPGAVRSAVQAFEELRSSPLFAGVTVGLLHGRLSDADKAAALASFASGSVHVLVATKVVEVGLDVPAATLVVVEHAHRFGLSALHQLRGRVGRADKPGSCILLYHDGAEAEAGGGGAEGGEAGSGGGGGGGGGAKQLSRAAERMRVLVSETDGLRIAEADLAARGAGELLADADALSSDATGSGSGGGGAEQSGRLACLRLARLEADGRLLEVARETAARLCTHPGGLHPALRYALRCRDFPT